VPERFPLPTTEGERTVAAAAPQRVGDRRVTRTQVEFRDGSEGRVYVADDGSVYPSVSTVVGSRDGDTTGLDRWKATHDGSAGAADWRDLLAFKSAVGTLAHHAVLDPYADRDLWGAEERAAEASLADLGSFAYPVDGGVEERDAVAFGEEAVAWCRDNAGEALSDLVAAVDVERFLIDEERGYAGQVDLVYETDLPNCSLAVGDLKTSKRVYHKHRLQAEAYAAALDGSADVLKVARLDPYRRAVEESYSFQWVDPRSRWTDPATRADLRTEVESLAAEFHEERLPVRRPLPDERG
jgi:predicted heme/steroid binding protein